MDFFEVDHGDNCLVMLPMNEQVVSTSSTWQMDLELLRLFSLYKEKPGGMHGAPTCPEELRMSPDVAAKRQIHQASSVVAAMQTLQAQTNDFAAYIYMLSWGRPS